MPKIRLLMALRRPLLLVLMAMVWLPLPSSMSVNSGLTETSVGVSCCTSNLVPHILIVHLRGRKRSKARIIHNWKPKHKREGENPLQINKAHRKRRKEKQNEKAKRKLKNVLASCKMEDRENYHEIGLIDNPHYTHQFISKKQDILRGKLPENIDDNIEPHEMEELTMSGNPRTGALDDGSKATDTKGKDEILMTNQLDNDEELLWDDLVQGAHDLLETADVLKDPKQFSEGDIVKYRESDGTFRMAEIVSIDRSIIPHSYGIRLEVNR